MTEMTSSRTSTVASAAPILRLRGVGRRFGGVQAVRDVDLEIRAGERRAILGPNGAGKTTLFNVIAGEFPPTSGSVEIFGQDMTDKPARARVPLGVTRTFQISRLFGGLSVADNLYVAIIGEQGGHLRPLRLGKDQGYRERARALGEQIGLANVLDTPVGLLSHGEQRQLEIGMALAGEPKLLMLDEPAAGLARAERVKLTEMLLGFDRTITVVLIEHDMDVALTVAEYVTMMHDGHVVVEGTPDEIRSNTLVHDLYLGRRHTGDE
jgi:branched-chain amino acid transport system ATP-binding protein